MPLRVLAGGWVARLAVCSSLFTSLGAFAETPRPIVKAAEYGMSSEAEDNTDALRKALAACQENRAEKLIIDKGVYRFKSGNTGQPWTVASMQNLQDFTIEAPEATVLLTGNPEGVTILKAEACQNLTILGLSFDCAELPFAQGMITSYDGKGRLELSVDPKFPLRPGASIESVIDCDAETGAMLANIDLYKSAIQSIEHPAPGRLVLTFSSKQVEPDPARTADLEKLKNILPGKKVVLRTATYGGSTFDFLKCSDVVLRDIDIRAMAGMGLMARESRNFLLQRVRIAPPEGSGRLMSTTKDGLHFTHVSGSVALEDCVLRAMGDDALNVYAKLRNVKRITAANAFTMVFDRNRGWQGPTPEPGETLRFWESRSMDPLGSAKVKSAAWSPKEKQFTVQFEKDLPKGVSAADWVSSDTYLPSVSVRNCQFWGPLGRAAVFSTNNVTMEGCVISHTAYTGILLTSGARHERQGPAPQNIVIRHNHFEGTGGAAIFGYVVTPEPGSRAMNNIAIEDNVIQDDPALLAQRLKSRRPDWMHWAAGICLSDASDIRITGNQFSGYPVSLFLENATGVSLTNNTFTPPSQAILNKVSEAQEARDNPGLEIQRDQSGYDPELYYIGILR